MKRITVYADFDFLTSPEEIGTLGYEHIRGKDYFVFQINKEGTDKGFRPFDSNDCRPTTGMRYLPSAGCAKLIKDNNWKFPHNYPIKL